MRTIKVKIFKFSELSYEAKERAREWYRETLDYDWWDFVYEDFQEIAKILGIEIATRQSPLMGGGTRAEPEIFFSGFSSQGDGACYCGRYSYAPGCRKKIREHAPQDAELHRIADGLFELQRRHRYRIEARITTSGRYSHSHTMQFDVSNSVTGHEFPDEVNKELAELLRDLADWLYAQLEREYEWLTADEQVDDSIEANEYEFHENGTIA